MALVLLLGELLWGSGSSCPLRHLTERHQLSCVATCAAFSGHVKEWGVCHCVGDTRSCLGAEGGLQLLQQEQLLGTRPKAVASCDRAAGPLSRPLGKGGSRQHFASRPFICCLIITELQLTSLGSGAASCLPCARLGQCGGGAAAVSCCQPALRSRCSR